MEIIKAIGSNIVIVIMAALGLMAPGVLTIFLFNREFFISLELLKLLLLSFSICMPTFCFAMGTLFLFDETEMSIFVECCVGCVFNCIIFSIMLSVKIFYRSMNSKMLIIGLILLCVLSFVYYRKNHNKIGKIVYDK